MPSLNWIGKEAVANHDKEVPFKQNLIIHGDNLEALKALMPYYIGRVKCIYIDPPYNKGSRNGNEMHPSSPLPRRVATVISCGWLVVCFADGLHFNESVERIALAWISMFSVLYRLLAAIALNTVFFGGEYKVMRTAKEL